MIPLTRMELGVPAQQTPDAPERSLRRLALALARRARGRTLICQRYGPGFAALLREQRPEASFSDALEAPRGPAVEGERNTVMIVGVLESLARATWPRWLAEGWRLLAPGGRLVVCGANPEAGPICLPDWNRRHLRKALKSFGPAVVAGDQPYRWIIMAVQKSKAPRNRLPRTRKERYRITSRLCRGRVIELGCGEGHLAGLIAARGHSVVGVDLSRAKIEAAEREYPEVEFLACDIAKLQLPEGSFDTTILAEVLEHVDASTGNLFLTTAWRLIRPGGRLVVSVPNEDSVPHRNHIRTFDRRQLRALLRPFGRPRLIADQPYQWLMMVVDK